MVRPRTTAWCAEHRPQLEYVDNRHGRIHPSLPTASTFNHHFHNIMHHAYKSKRSPYIVVVHLPRVPSSPTSTSTASCARLSTTPSPLSYGANNHLTHVAHNTWSIPLPTPLSYVDHPTHCAIVINHIPSSTLGATITNLHHNYSPLFVSSPSSATPV